MFSSSPPATPLRQQPATPSNAKETGQPTSPAQNIWNLTQTPVSNRRANRTDDVNVLGSPIMTRSFPANRQRTMLLALAAQTYGDASVEQIVSDATKILREVLTDDTDSTPAPGESGSPFLHVKEEHQAELREFIDTLGEAFGERNSTSPRGKGGSGEKGSPRKKRSVSKRKWIPTSFSDEEAMEAGSESDSTIFHQRMDPCYLANRR
jgi:hypothetical protein